MKMTRANMKHILNALEAAEAELEELETSQSWFSSDSLEQIYSSQQILREQLDDA